ncbi:hypothetical protein JL720_15206 [Aureococcus anophagefferens]|nr:hypothetical protein JL720_15206 [Aureococcus anophagefferens]
MAGSCYRIMCRCLALLTISGGVSGLRDARDARDERRVGVFETSSFERPAERAADGGAERGGSRPRRADKSELEAAVDAWLADADAATLTYGPISRWDVSAVTDGGSCFVVIRTARITRAQSVNGDISGWDTSAVTTMGCTPDWYESDGADSFTKHKIATSMDSYGIRARLTDVDGDGDHDVYADAATLTYGHISTWDTSAVTDMSELFRFTDFNADISGWNTASVTDMSWMFSSANAFNEDIGAWNTASVKDMNGMFANADVFNQDIGAWDTSSVTDMSWMFEAAYAFDQDIGAWNTASVADMSGVFYDASAFDQDLDWCISSSAAASDFATSSGCAVADCGVSFSSNCETPQPSYMPSASPPTYPPTASPSALLPPTPNPTTPKPTPAPSSPPTASFLAITSIGTASTCVHGIECELLWAYRSPGCATVKVTLTDPDGNEVGSQTIANDGQQMQVVAGRWFERRRADAAAVPTRQI